MRIYEHGIDMLGVNHRSSYARYFVKRSMRKIHLQALPGNKRDSNTMKVMGKSKGWFFEVERCIGFVPADIARKLVVSGMENSVKVRLQMICIEDNDSINIRFDILGPTDDFERYCA